MWYTFYLAYTDCLRLLWPFYLFFMVVRPRVLWTYVQRVYGRTSLGGKDVRPEGAWTYVHRTFERAWMGMNETCVKSIDSEQFLNGNEYAWNRLKNVVPLHRQKVTTTWWHEVFEILTTTVTTLNNLFIWTRIDVNETWIDVKLYFLEFSFNLRGFAFNTKTI